MEIFVAEVTDDLRLSRKRLIKKLVEMQAKVHFGIPPPFIKEEHDKTFYFTLDNCQVTVHILGQYPGRSFEGGEEEFILLHQAVNGLA